VGSLERRIEDLERLYNLAPSSEEQERRLAERRVEMHALMQDAEKRAEREAAAGDTRRQRALAELEERIKRRRGRAS
jgi:hypothetical protein